MVFFVITNNLTIFFKHLKKIDLKKMKKLVKIGLIETIEKKNGMSIEDNCGLWFTGKSSFH